MIYWNSWFTVLFQVYSKVIKLNIYMCVCILFFTFYSIIGYYKIVNIDSSHVMHRVLIRYLFYS